MDQPRFARNARTFPDHPLHDHGWQPITDPGLARPETLREAIAGPRPRMRELSIALEARDCDRHPGNAGRYPGQLSAPVEADPPVPATVPGCGITLGALTDEISELAKPNYSFEKRQREIAKKKKQDEKDARKREAREAANATTDQPPSPSDSSDPPASE